MGWIQSTIFAKSSIFNVWVGSKYVSDYLGAFSIINNPPGIKTSWRRLSVRPSDVAGTSQMEHPTTSRWNVAKASQWYVSTTVERRENILKRRSNGVPSVRLHDLLNKSQMKHPTTSQWYLTKMSQWYISTTSHFYASATFPLSPKWNNQ